MSTGHQVKSTHKAVKDYYTALQTYAGQHVAHEGAVCSAFQNLLADTGSTTGELSDICGLFTPRRRESDFTTHRRRLCNVPLEEGFWRLVRTRRFARFAVRYVCVSDVVIGEDA
ncbi:MAG: hypothetical protein ABIG44_12695 [Planctomycetota bacterium]